MRALFLAPTTKGFGETILGIRLAADLRRNGHDVRFLVHSSGSQLVGESGFRCRSIAPHALPLFDFLVSDEIRQWRPDALILSDLFTVSLAMARAKTSLASLKRHDIPIVAIDTWSQVETGKTIDIFGKPRWQMPSWPRNFGLRVTPVPFANPLNAGAAYYSSLPTDIEFAKKIRRHVRRTLGVTDSSKLVLLCTAEWQHANYPSAAATRLQAAVPRVLGSCIDRLGPAVHLVHVGPVAWSPSPCEKYLWLPPTPPDRFNVLLSAADLVLTLNVSSTTIGRAIAARVPVASLVNSLTARTPKGLPCAGLEGTVAEATPTFAFDLWPLGYHDFLRPVWKGNPLCEVLPRLEVFSIDETLASLDSMLFSRETRSAAINAEAAYARSVRSLRPAPDTIAEFVA